ncbi:2-amino-4-hydroxy-6-hydroxymethyldihydropteridine diphosphokinase [Gymnodinialimonas ulvae]|uniref:2-amino-4-hydroxy-6- hydroxymethyldihydropteridine diphosphokinase n=1 Tax=Gymnodinialimonas ulvae TaxID=3126504 RepID=UPI003095FDB7
MMTKRDVTTCLIALGANLPKGGISPEVAVSQAMDRVAEACDGAVARSRLFRTPAFPEGAGPDFVNAAMRVEWQSTAQALLAHLHGIEAAFGRRREARWEARVMDLDLIGFGDAILPDPETRARWAGLSPEDAAQVVPDQLIVPHPRLAERGFVLVPLADVAPDWVDPTSGRSVGAMVQALPHAVLETITPLGGCGESGCQ